MNELKEARKAAVLDFDESAVIMVDEDGTIHIKNAAVVGGLLTRGDEGFSDEALEGLGKKRASTHVMCSRKYRTKMSSPSQTWQAR